MLLHQDLRVIDESYARGWDELELQLRDLNPTIPNLERLPTNCCHYLPYCIMRQNSTQTQS